MLEQASILVNFKDKPAKAVSAEESKEEQNLPEENAANALGKEYFKFDLKVLTEDAGEAKDEKAPTATGWALLAFKSAAEARHYLVRLKQDRLALNYLTCHELAKLLHIAASAEKSPNA